MSAQDLQNLPPQPKCSLKKKVLSSELRDIQAGTSLTPATSTRTRKQTLHYSAEYQGARNIDSPELLEFESNEDKDRKNKTTKKNEKMTHNEQITAQQAAQNEKDEDSNFSDDFQEELPKKMQKKRQKVKTTLRVQIEKLPNQPQTRKNNTQDLTDDLKNNEDPQSILNAPINYSGQNIPDPKHFKNYNSPSRIYPQTKTTPTNNKHLDEDKKQNLKTINSIPPTPLIEDPYSETNTIIFKSSINKNIDDSQLEKESQQPSISNSKEFSPECESIKPKTQVFRDPLLTLDLETDSSLDLTPSNKQSYSNQPAFQEDTIIPESPEFQTHETQSSPINSQPTSRIYKDTSPKILNKSPNKDSQITISWDTLCQFMNNQGEKMYQLLSTQMQQSTDELKEEIFSLRQVTDELTEEIFSQRQQQKPQNKINRSKTISTQTEEEILKKTKTTVLDEDVTIPEAPMSTEIVTELASNQQWKTQNWNLRKNRRHLKRVKFMDPEDPSKPATSSTLTSAETQEKTPTPSSSVFSQKQTKKTNLTSSPKNKNQNETEVQIEKSQTQVSSKEQNKHFKNGNQNRNIQPQGKSQSSITRKQTQQTGTPENQQQKTLFIKPKDTTYTISQIYDFVKELTPSVLVQDIRLTGTTIILQCHSAQDVDQLLTFFQDYGELREYTKIEKFQIPKRKIFITSLPLSTNTDALIDCLSKFSTNSEVFRSISKVTKKIEKESERKASYIVECPSKDADFLISQHKIIFGLATIFCRRFRPSIRCQKCQCLGGACLLNGICQNEVSCPYCAQPHNAEDCDSQTYQCANCLLHNEEHNTKLDPRHPAYEPSCPLAMRLRSAIEQGIH